jgi:hypothetical protein
MRVVATYGIKGTSGVGRMGQLRQPLVTSDPRSPAAQAYRDFWAELSGLLA